MLNPITAQELAKTHQRDQTEVWKEGEARRISRQVTAAQPAQPGLVKRIARRVDALLKRLSQRLAEQRALPG